MGLKKKLFESGLKKNVCEMCGQNENWFGKKMSMVLDHVNGRHNDCRLENLRILCPNCNSTLETHCGKKNRKPCPVCGKLKIGSKFCSRECYMKSRIGQVRERKVERPTYEVLMKEVKELGYSGVGRKYKVSDNAIRLWVRRYETGRTR